MPNKKQKQVVQAPRQMTRGQLSRHQRELQRTRQLNIAMAAIGAVVLLIIGGALLNQFVLKPNTSVGQVNDQTITQTTYNTYRKWQIYNQMRILDFYVQQGQAGGSSTQTTQYQTQITQLQTELQGIETWPTRDTTTLTQLGDNMLMAQKAGDLGVSISDAEVLSAAQTNFAPQPTPVPGPTGTPGPPTATPSATATGGVPTATATSSGTPATDTPTATRTATHTPTPGPSPTSSKTPTITATPLPVPGAQQTAVASYNDFLKAIAGGPKPAANGYCSLGCPGLSAQDYTDLVARPDALKKKITTTLGAKVATTQDEVHAQHILVADEATAKDVKAQLDKGADFAALAAKYSTDTSNKATGGDLGWFAPTEKGGSMVQEFSTAAFALTKPGQISDPVKSQFGWHIIRLIERGPRPLTSTELDTAKSKAFDDWLKSEKDKSTYRLDVPATPTPNPTAAPLPTAPPPAPLTTRTVPAQAPAAGTPGAGQTTIPRTPTGVAAPAGTTPAKSP